MNDVKAVAVKAAKEAGKILLALSANPIKYKMKGSHDIQAEADLRSEKIILDIITSAFPSHSIISEEAGEQKADAAYLWAVDPLDGTINYARGIDEFCVSIALTHNDQTILGVVYQPVMQQLFVAEKGKGSYVNDEQIHVSSERDMIRSLVATDASSDLNMRQANFAALAKISTSVRQARIYGSSALHLVRVAQGHIDFYFKMHTNYWDCAAGALIVQEAGGVVTDIDGQPFTRDSQTILAGSKAIHAQALTLLGSG
jgi:myo-inositol-1(or 4)-monophosphatase